MSSLFPAYLAYGAEHTSVEEYAPGTTAGEPYLPGSLVFYDTTDNTIDLCGADPALILGISEIVSSASLGTAAVSGAANTALTPDGLHPIRIIKGAGAVLALSSTTTPAQTHVGDAYGVTKTSAGIWQLDTGKTGGSARVRVERVDITNGIFYVVVLTANLQLSGI